MKKHWPLIAAFVLVTIGTWVGLGVFAFHWLRRSMPRPEDPASIEAARERRTAPAVEPAPAPLPTALPLVGGDGIMADGYPVAHVDGAAFRSLLWHGKYEELNRYFDELQSDFETDNKREYWISGAADAFGSAEASLTERLDAWVAATPGSFAPHLARGAHWNGVAWARRGAHWAKDTPAADMAAMNEAFDHAWTDLTTALSLRPKLVHARLLRVRVLSARSDHRAMRAEVDRAIAVCPGCYRIRVVYLLDTTPRWGGTYDAMRAFAATCDPAVNVRCRVLPGFVDNDLADLAWIDSKMADAEGASNRAVALGDCASFLLERSNIRRIRSDFAGALEDADRALALWYDASTLVARSDALFGLKRWEPAGRALLETLRLDPTESQAKYIAPYVVKNLEYEGWNDAQAGRREEGLRLYDLAAELAPLDDDVLGRRARLLLGSDNPDIATLEAAVEKNPDDLRLHQQLDYALSAKGDFARIAAMWTEYIGRHPDDARAFMERAGTYHRLGRAAESHADAVGACELGLNEGCMRAK